MSTYTADSLEDVAQFWDHVADSAHARQNSARTKRDIRDAEVEERCYREVAHHMRHLQFSAKATS